MRDFELEFFPKSDVKSAEYFSLLYRFGSRLAENGLVLDGVQRLSMRDKNPVLYVVAQDDDAIAEANMSRETLETLAAIIELSTAIPAVIPKELCFDIRHCECEKPGYFVLQAPAEAAGTPVKCGDCGLSVPLYRLIRDPDERDFTELLRWRRLYRAYLCQYFANFEPRKTHNMLQGCVSTLALHGRRQCGIIEAATGILTLYPLFARFERLPKLCPQCGQSWVNPYSDAIKYERFCRQCRLVMNDEGKIL